MRRLPLFAIMLGAVSTLTRCAEAPVSGSGQQGSSSASTNSSVAGGGSGGGSSGAPPSSSGPGGTLNAAGANAVIAGSSGSGGMVSSELTRDDVLSLQEGAFYLDGRPFAELSFNKFDLFWALWEEARVGNALDDANPMVVAQDKALRNLHQLGFRTIRVFGLPWGPGGPAAFKDPAQRLKLWAALDKMVELCEKHDISVVWSLSAGSFTDTVLEPNGTWVHGEEQARELMANAESRGRQLAYQYIDEVVGRYRGSRAVLAWEVSNELTLLADIGDADKVYEGERMPTLANVAQFLDDVARRVKSVDPLRLVNSGGSNLRAQQWHLSQGQGWVTDDAGQQQRCFEMLYSRSSVDIMDIHFYPNNEPGVQLAGPADATNVLDLAGYSKMAANVGKPLMVGELGALPILRTNVDVWQKTPNYFESFSDTAAATPWVRAALDDAVDAGVPLAYWWTYQSDRAQDQNLLDRMDLELSRTPELVSLVVDANRRLQDKLGIIR